MSIIPYFDYDDRLEIYRQLKEDNPNNKLIDVCVARYEINLTKWNLTSNEKYKLLLHAIGKILDTFIGLENVVDMEVD